MSKSKPSRPPMFLPSRFCSRRRCEDGFQVRAQVGVFGPQVDDAVPGADHAGADRHALEHQVGEVGEDHAVFERARLAFVGVADDVFLLGLGVRRPAPTSGWWESPRRRGPRSPSGRSRPALRPASWPSAALRPLPGSMVGKREGPGSRRRCVMSGAPLPTSVAWTPNVCRHCCRMPWTFSGVTRVKIWSLTSMAGPWSHIPRQFAQWSENLPSGVVSPNRMPRSFSNCRATCVLAGHVAGDRAAEPDHELPLRLLVQEAVERDDAVDLHRMDVQQVGDDLHAVFGDAEVPPLHLLQNRQQRTAPRP